MTGQALGVAIRIMSNDSFFDGIVIRPNRIIVLTAGARRLLRLLRLRLLWLRRWLWRRAGEERLDGSWNIFIFAFLGRRGGEGRGNMKTRRGFRGGLGWPRNAGSGLDIDHRVGV